MTLPYLDPLIKESGKLANVKYAEDMSRYMRNQFAFLGLNSPTRNRLFKDHIVNFGLPDPDEFRNYVEILWNLQEREFQYYAISFLIKLKKHYKENDIGWFENLIISKSWWDTVDGLAAWVIGTYFIKYAHQITSVTRNWMDSGNIWLQRTSLLFQLKYKEKTNEDLLYSYIIELSESKEFFVQKAIGWSLREFSKTYPDKVEKFVRTNILAPLSIREALKIINKKK